MCSGKNDKYTLVSFQMKLADLEGVKHNNSVVEDLNNLFKKKVITHYTLIVS